jgi:hypothetical protein
MKPLHQPCGQIKDNSVYDQCEQAEGQDIDREGQEQQNRPKKGVEETYDKSAGQERLPSIHVYAGDDIDHDKKRHGVNKPFNQKTLQLLPPLCTRHLLYPDSKLYITFPVMPQQKRNALNHGAGKYLLKNLDPGQGI